MRGEGSGAFGSSRVYDKVDGSTCHQCRQKTLGARTSCSQCHSHVACSPRPPSPLLGTPLLLLSDSHTGSASEPVRAHAAVSCYRGGAAVELACNVRSAPLHRVSRRQEGVLLQNGPLK